VDFVLVPFFKGLIAVGEVLGFIVGFLLGLWPLWLVILIIAACVKVLSG
jgi:hypothetical protein